MLRIGSIIQKENNMAKLEKTLQGDFNQIAHYINDSILNGSVSASFEDESIFTLPGGITVRHLVYERYSAFSSNRVSLSIVLTSYWDDTVHISAITAGGSNAMFFKIDTVGEGTFLAKLEEALAAWGR